MIPAISGAIGPLGSGEWSIGVTFFIFVIFMLFRPTGLFAAAR